MAGETSEGTVAKIKGSLIIHIKKTIVGDYGQKSFEQVLAVCQEETVVLLNGVILSAAFYPEAILADLVKGCRHLVGEEAFPRFAREMAKSQVNSLLKWVVRLFVDPKRFSDNNNKLWQALHDSGRVEVRHGDDNLSHTVDILDFEFCNADYEIASMEFHCGILELTGAKEVVGTTARTGPKSYRQYFTWKM